MQKFLFIMFILLTSCVSNKKNSFDENNLNYKYFYDLTIGIIESGENFKEFVNKKYPHLNISEKLTGDKEDDLVKFMNYLKFLQLNKIKVISIEFFGNHIFVNFENRYNYEELYNNFELKLPVATGYFEFEFSENNINFLGIPGLTGPH